MEPQDGIIKYRRVCGRLEGAQGPTLVLVGGLHGNEPAGLDAAMEVLEALKRQDPPIRGRLFLLAGNLKGLAANQRFLDRDMNRIWTEERIRKIRSDPSAFDGEAEVSDQRELLAAIEAILRDARGEAYFLDLHTSSAAGCPFLTVGDTLRNRKFALHFPLPLILGLEEQLEGSLLEYLNNRGLVTLGVEGGRHDAPASRENFRAVLNLAMAAIGMIDPANLPDLEAFRRSLAEACTGVPRVMEIRYRFAIASSDRFRMEPGFTNFRPVRRGELLATDRNGEIRSILDGLILLPLYQGKGNDGFFLATEFRPFWLSVSRWMRKLGMGRWLALTPGVRPHPDREGVLMVNTRIARWFPLKMFRLAGFRKLRRQGKLLLVTRRKYDRRPPESYAE